MMTQQRHSSIATYVVASTRRQARTDGGGGEKESSVPELCSLENVCGQACVYRHIARCLPPYLSTIKIRRVNFFSTTGHFAEFLSLYTPGSKIHVHVHVHSENVILAFFSFLFLQNPHTCTCTCISRHWGE